MTPAQICAAILRVKKQRAVADGKLIALEAQLAASLALPEEGQRTFHFDQFQAVLRTGFNYKVARDLDIDACVRTGRFPSSLTKIALDETSARHMRQDGTSQYRTLVDSGLLVVTPAKLGVNVVRTT